MADASPSPTLLAADPPVAGIDGHGFRLRVDAALGIAKLRVRPASADTGFRSVAGCAPPAVGRQIERAPLAFAWLGPGEWLVTGPADAIATWVRDAEEIGGDEVLALDFTHARVAFEVGGEKARALLAAHCPLDLWPEAFPAGSVARSLLGDSAMFIARLEDEAGDALFRIIVDQTMAPYARRLLAGADQSQEYRP